MDSQVRIALSQDADVILPRADLRTLAKWVDGEPSIMIREAIESPLHRVWVGITEEKPVCLVGFMKESLLSDESAVWFVSVRGFMAKAVMRFRHQWKWYLDHMVQDPCIAYVDPEDKGAIRWAEWIGFSFDSVVKSGLYRMRKF